MLLLHLLKMEKKKYKKPKVLITNLTNCLLSKAENNKKSDKILKNVNNSFRKQNLSLNLNMINNSTSENLNNETQQDQVYELKSFIFNDQNNLNNSSKTNEKSNMIKEKSKNNNLFKTNSNDKNKFINKNLNSDKEILIDKMIKNNNEKCKYDTGKQYLDLINNKTKKNKKRSLSQSKLNFNCNNVNSFGIEIFQLKDVSDDDDSNDSDSFKDFYRNKEILFSSNLNNEEITTCNDKNSLNKNDSYEINYIKEDKNNFNIENEKRSSKKNDIPPKTIKEKISNHFVIKNINKSVSEEKSDFSKIDIKTKNVKKKSSNNFQEIKEEEMDDLSSSKEAENLEIPIKNQLINSTNSNDSAKSITFKQNLNSKSDNEKIIEKNFENDNKKSKNKNVVIDGKNFLNITKKNKSNSMSPEKKNINIERKSLGEVLLNNHYNNKENPNNSKTKQSQNINSCLSIKIGRKNSNKSLSKSILSEKNFNNTNEKSILSGKNKNNKTKLSNNYQNLNFLNIDFEENYLNSLENENKVNPYNYNDTLDEFKNGEKSIKNLPYMQTNETKTVNKSINITINKTKNSEAQELLSKRINKLIAIMNKERMLQNLIKTKKVEVGLLSKINEIQLKNSEEKEKENKYNSENNDIDNQNNKFSEYNLQSNKKYNKDDLIKIKNEKTHENDDDKEKIPIKSNSDITANMMIIESINKKFKILQNLEKVMLFKKIKLDKIKNIIEQKLNLDSTNKDLNSLFNLNLYELSENNYGNDVKEKGNYINNIVIFKDFLKNRNEKIAKSLNLSEYLEFNTNKLSIKSPYFLYETLSVFNLQKIKFDIPKNYKLIHLYQPIKTEVVDLKKINYYANDVIETIDINGTVKINYFNGEFEVYNYANGDKMCKSQNMTYMIYFNSKNILCYKFDYDKSYFIIDYNKKEMELKINQLIHMKK